MTAQSIYEISSTVGCTAAICGVGQRELQNAAAPVRSAQPKDYLTPDAVGVTPIRSPLLGINRFLASVLRKAEIDLDQCPATGKKP
jgi:hypothetical protein